MQRWQNNLAWFLGAVCLALSTITILLAHANQRMEQAVQAQQIMLERGILGPQGQQIGNSILQDLASTAQQNEEVRDLLGRHGFQISPISTNSMPGQSEEITNRMTRATGGAE